MTYDESFFVQRVPIIDITQSREEFFATSYCNKSVLHVGCADYPIFNRDTNLHCRLKPHIGQLHGFDTNREAVSVLRAACPGTYFTDVREIASTQAQYDCVLIPEVLEHVPNAELFLKEMFAIAAVEYLITAPNFSYYLRSKLDGNIFTEIVHPDHKCWYSPYTLYNLVHFAIGNSNTRISMLFLEHQSMV